MSLAVIQRWLGTYSNRVVIAACALGMLAGCATPPSPVQVQDRNTQQPVRHGHYTVVPGDTMWAIAFRFGWDWKELAQRNGIASPYVIYPGQRIHLDRPAVSGALAAQPVATPIAVAPARPVGSASAAPATPPPPVQAQPQPVQPVVRAPAAREPVVVSPSVAATTPVTPVARSASGWAWPHRGQVISRFSANGSLNKGIDIAGELGEPVVAASDGTVVYAGSGLRGYGELVIIKHSDTYVSAYGHNRRLLVREGQQVKVGQTIAEMGSTGADRVKLHFEIRRQGKPVDPLQYLPSR